MALTFVDTHNMIAFLTKSDESEGFEQIIDFLNAHKANDVVSLHALIDRKNVIITEDTISEALRLDAADGVDCLPNEEIFDVLEAAAENENDDNEVSAEPTPHLPTPATSPPPPQQEHIPLPAESAQPSSPSQQQPSQTAEISMTLLNQLLETCATMTKKVINLEQDKIAQALEIIKLKQRVRRLEKKRRLKISGLKRLRKVGTAQKVEFSADTVMDDKEDASKEEEKIAELDANEDITLETVDAENADVQGRLDESQAKLMTEVVTTTTTTTTTTITAAQVPKASAPRKRRDVVIHDPEETAIPSVIVHSEVKSKDKGKGILIEEPKPLKRQAQIDQDEAFARQLEAELNANINWNDIMDQVKRKEQQDNTVMRYQALKRKPVTEAHARKNMMRAAKKPRIDEEIKELKTHLQIVPNDEDDVYTKATPLALKVPVVDYQIHHEHNKPYYKIIRADGTHQLFLSFMILLVERKYPLTRFTLEQMLNNVRLEVEEESEMSLELLRKYAKGLLLLVEDLMLLVQVKAAR
nr:hypothetical protein [Tanacetum cinerariifolium]